MNMKQIVFTAVGILIMLVIIGWMLHSMAHIDEINQKRREKNAGEALASQIITTTATTSIWDSLRQTEAPSGAEMESGQQNPENLQETAGYEENYTPDGAVPENMPSDQTITEVAGDQEQPMIIVQ